MKPRKRMKNNRKEKANNGKRKEVKNVVVNTILEMKNDQNDKDFPQPRLRFTRGWFLLLYGNKNQRRGEKRKD